MGRHRCPRSTVEETTQQVRPLPRGDVQNWGLYILPLLHCAGQVLKVLWEGRWIIGLFFWDSSCRPLRTAGSIFRAEEA